MKITNVCQWKSKIPSESFLKRLRSSADIPQRDDRVGKKIFVHGRAESIRTDSTRQQRFTAFVCHPSADIPPRSALETCTLFTRFDTVFRARKCFPTVVAVNCTCQPDIIDPARREELRTGGRNRVKHWPRVINDGPSRRFCA